MAWLELEVSGRYHVAFRERKFKRSLRTANQCDAEAACVHVDENLRPVECDRLDIPANADIATFLLSDAHGCL
jgi:hypothetical protein